MSDLERPQLIDRCRCTVTPLYRRRLRDRLRFFAVATEPARLIRFDVTLNTARSDGSRPAGDDDELIVELMVAERWLAGVGLLVPPAWSRRLMSAGVRRY